MSSCYFSLIFYTHFSLSFFVLISVKVGEAGSEGFAWYAVTKGREEVVISRDK